MEQQGRQRRQWSRDTQARRRAGGWDQMAPAWKTENGVHAGRAFISPQGHGTGASALHAAVGQL